MAFSRMTAKFWILRGTEFELISFSLFVSFPIRENRFRFFFLSLLSFFDDFFPGDLDFRARAALKNSTRRLSITVPPFLMLSLMEPYL
jgi:hypothetical protein